MKRWVMISLMCAAALGCGVRGDPVPPGTPAELGRGKPNYKRATEDLAFPVVTPPDSRDDEEERERESEN